MTGVTVHEMTERIDGPDRLAAGDADRAARRWARTARALRPSSGGVFAAQAISVVGAGRAVSQPQNEAEGQVRFGSTTAAPRLTEALP